MEVGSNSQVGVNLESEVGVTSQFCGSLRAKLVGLCLVALEHWSGCQFQLGKLGGLKEVGVLDNQIGLQLQKLGRL